LQAREPSLHADKRGWGRPWLRPSSGNQPSTTPASGVGCSQITHADLAACDLASRPSVSSLSANVFHKIFLEITRKLRIMVNSSSPRGHSMSARYLFGPVSKNFADQNLKGPVERGECLIFDDDGSFPVRSDDSWETVASRLPAGWQPDFPGSVPPIPGHSPRNVEGADPHHRPGRRLELALAPATSRDAADNLFGPAVTTARRQLVGAMG
jgi:hypothetical protein